MDSDDHVHAGTGEIPSPSPISDREWVDEGGRHWRLRGAGRKAAKRFEHLVQSSDVRVLHFYGIDAPTDLAGVERDQFWRRVRPYLDHPGGQDPEGMTAFNVAEFKDGDGRSLLVIEESC